MNPIRLSGWFGKIAVLALLLVSAAPAVAQQVAIRQVEVTATGINEMDAIMQAMVLAINQVNGTRVGGITISVVRESVRDGKVTSAAELARAAVSITQGAVKSYEVLESGKEQAAPGKGADPAQAWRVRIRASVATYAAGAQLKRLRLTVVALRLPDALKQNPAAKKFASDFTEKLETLLTQSRRFAMLDRQFAEAVDKELAQYTSTSFAPEETARIGRKAGTDYLVLGTLAKYEIVDQSVHMTMSDRTIPRKTARALIQLRLIDVATSQIKYAKNFETGDNTARTTGEAAAMLDGIAEKASSEIIASVYPIAIVAADAASVTLGQGGDTIKAGQRFQVFALGEALKDPYTGESLGRRESMIGMVEVTSVTDRVSTAKIIDGSAAIGGKGGKDMIVRSAPLGAGPTAAAEAPKASGKGTRSKAKAADGKPDGAKAGGKDKDEDW